MKGKKNKHIRHKAGQRSKRSTSSSRKGSDAKQHFSLFLSSFSQMKSLRAFFTVCFDLLFYVLAVPLTAGFAYLINSIIKPMEGMSTSIMFMSPDTAYDLQSSLSRIVMSFILIIAAYVIAMMVCFWFSRYLLWISLLDKKFSLKAMGKFFLLNAIWFAAAGIGMYVLIMPIKTMSSPAVLMIYSFFMVIVPVFLLIYLTYIMYYLFMEKGQVFRSFTGAFSKGVSCFRHLWLPVLLMVAVFIAASIASMLSRFMPEIASNLYAAALVLAFFTWVKLYAVSVLRLHVRP